MSMGALCVFSLMGCQLFWRLLPDDLRREVFYELKKRMKYLVNQTALKADGDTAMNIDTANKELEDKEIKSLLNIKTLNESTHIERALPGSEPISLDITNNILFPGQFRVTKSEIHSINAWGASTGSAAVWFGYLKGTNEDEIKIYMPGSTATYDEIAAAVESLIEAPANVYANYDSVNNPFGVYKANAERLMIASGVESEPSYLYDMDNHILGRYLSSVFIISKSQLSELLSYFKTVNAPMFKLGISRAEVVIRLEGSISGAPTEIKDNIARITSIPSKDIILQIITLN